MKINDRVFVSFDEPCLYECKHCYTYGIKRDKIRTVNEIVEDISGERFDVIYVSQKNDNFSEPTRGINLCYKLFERYKQNIFIITRNVFSEEEIVKLLELKNKISNEGKQLFIAISINAIDSIHVCENVYNTSTPKKRMDFIKKLGEKGFCPILMLRPIFPNDIIPVKECLQIIEDMKTYISCVVTSGLGVNGDILNRLGMKEKQFQYLENEEYLDGAIDCEIKFIDVNFEIEQIYSICRKLNIPMFLHSMPALNYINEKSYNNCHV